MRAILTTTSALPTAAGHAQTTSTSTSTITGFMPAAGGTLPTLPVPGGSRVAGSLGRAAEASLQLRACLRARGADLVELALWLGGTTWERHARDLVELVLGGQGYSRRARALVEALARLFALRAVPGAEEGAAGPWVCVDPHDPRVERCCEYAELLERTDPALRAVAVAQRRAGRRVYRPATRPQPRVRRLRQG